MHCADAVLSVVKLSPGPRFHTRAYLFNRQCQRKRLKYRGCNNYAFYCAGRRSYNYFVLLCSTTIVL